MQAIALVGCRNSGRSALATFIDAKPGFKKLSFDDGPKELLYKINPYWGVNPKTGTLSSLKQAVDSVGWHDLLLYPEVERLLGLTKRGAVECFGEGAWIPPLRRTITSLAGENPVIDDVENVSQAVWCREEGAYMVKVIRPGIEPETVDEMELEAYDGFDFVINNDRNLEELKSKSNILLSHLGDPTWIKGGMI